MKAGTARHTRASLIVLAAAGALAAVVYALNRGPAPEPEATAPAPTAQAPAAPPAAVPGSTGETAEAPAAATTEAAPSFDLVRVAPDGSAVVAGTAAPGAEVTVYADAVPLASVTADDDGKFVAMFQAKPSEAPQALTLGAGERRSAETVMLLPAAPPAPVSDVAAAPAPAAQEGGPAPAPEVAATAIVGPESVEALPAPGTAGRLSLGSISYAEAGAVTLAGVARPGAVLRAYVDDRLAKETAVGADGRWRLGLDDVAAGLYRLRIDEIAPDGTVASRIETPFQRDFPKAPLPRPGGPQPVPPGGAITVQPGNNLWTIAQTHYGSGVLYTQIFTANRELIRDPELIYPGQIFTMPEIPTPRSGGPASRPAD